MGHRSILTNVADPAGVHTVWRAFDHRVRAVTGPVLIQCALAVAWKSHDATGADATVRIELPPVFPAGSAIGPPRA